MLKVQDTEKFPQALGFKNLVPSLSQRAGSIDVSQPYTWMDVTRDMYSLNLRAQLMVLQCKIVLSLATAEASLIRISAEHIISAEHAV